MTVALAAFYGISNQSNLDIRAPRAELLLATPRLHSRHHVPATTQHNYGTTVTVRDRLFGTLVRADIDADDR